MSEPVCTAAFPCLEALEEAVRLLASRYPEDSIEWRGDGRALALQAVEAARWAFQLEEGDCIDRGLAAAATLLVELASLHPLTDGNKRLAVLVTAAFLVRNRLPLPGSLYEAALRAAGGGSPRSVLERLRRDRTP